MRAGPAVATLASLILLAGCSLIPTANDSSRDSDDDDSSEAVQLTANDLEDLLDEDDVPSAFDLDLNFGTRDSDDKLDSIESYWGDAGVGPDCHDSYAASYLVGNDNDDDEFADLGVQESDESEAYYNYVSVDARAFDDPDDAADFFDYVRDAAEQCNDADGYQLVDGEGEVIWQVSRVDVDDTDLDLPDGVEAIYQQEIVDEAFAESYRVTMLQYGNVVVAVTAQPSSDGSFDLDDADELAETLAEKLVELG